MDRKQIICKLNSKRLKLDKFRRTLINSYPKLNKALDSRMTFFNIAISQIDTAILSLMVSDTNLWNDGWWTKTAPVYELNPPPVSSIPAMVLSYERFVVLYYFVGIFSIFESSVRMIAYKVDPKYRYFNSFDSIFKAFAKQISIRNRLKYYELFDIMRMIRNSIHNNGVFRPDTKPGRIPNDVEKKWRGVKVKFEVDKPISAKNFWRLAIFATPDLFNLMHEIVKQVTPLFIKEEDLVEDKSVNKKLAKYYFSEPV
jgi:hypothetical protein